MDVKVSVIIPVYNEEKNIAECLESVIKQTLKEIEIICVDDGSNDNSVQIIENTRTAPSPATRHCFLRLRRLGFSGCR